MHYLFLLLNFLFYAGLLTWFARATAPTIWKADASPMPNAKKLKR